jgi:hypothetical protein
MLPAMRRPVLLVLLALPACRHRPDHDSDGPPGETDPADPFAGIELVSADGESFGDLGYEVARFEVTEAAAQPYRTASDSNPAFYVLRPAASEEEAPVLLWLHGGALGDDSEGTPAPCEEADNLATALLERSLLVPQMAIARGWAMLVPVNEFCDGWHGLGAADPVDPERHWGQAHAQLALDFVRADRAGFDAAEELYGWGTSAGAAGLVYTASQYPGFDGLVVDSAPCDLYAYAEQDPLAIHHVLGGLPQASDVTDEVLRRYDEHSCDRIVAAGGVTAPLFLAWNSHDQLVPPVHSENLAAALAVAYGASGGRYGVHDFAHESPGDSFHVQTRIARAPLGYVSELMFRFLEGGRVALVEAEAGCEAGCTVGEVVTSTEEPVLNFSAQSGREAPAGSAGVLYSGRPPEGVAAGDRVEATAILGVAGSEGLPESTIVGRLVAGEAVRVLTLADFAAEGAQPRQDGAELLAQLQATKLAFTVGDPAATVLTLETEGAVTLRLDAIAWTTWP